MLGLLFVAIATLSKEIGTVIGKKKVAKHEESIYTMGFLGMLWGALILTLTGFVRDSLLLDPASFPTLSIRLVLEIAQMHVTILAITTASRSAFGFLRIWTIPALLVVDLTLGYAIGTPQLFGIGLIVLSFMILFINHGIKSRGAGLVLFTAFNAVATISLYKYDITHFNSVETEQSIAILVVLLYMALRAIFSAHENPIRFLVKPIFLFQSLTSGVATVLMSFAYLFAPASIITTGKRSLAILWSMISGNIYFHEKKFAIKLVSLILIVAGLILLAI